MHAKMNKFYIFVNIAVAVHACTIINNTSLILIYHVIVYTQRPDHVYAQDLTLYYLIEVLQFAYYGNLGSLTRVDCKQHTGKARRHQTVHCLPVVGVDGPALTANA
jgi:hypothetical protein